MHIDNVRLGFPTNSSSSHSIIWMPDGAEDNTSPLDAPGAYGWGNFTLASRELKEDYYRTLLVMNLLRIPAERGEHGKVYIPHWAAEAIADRIMCRPGDTTPLSMDDSYQRECYIDHQSVLSLPSSWDESFHSNLLDLDFCRDLYAFLMRDEVVILGGNDNDPDGHPFIPCGDKMLGGMLGYGGGGDRLVCRKDGDWWTLYNRSNGYRVRVSFEREPRPFVAETPLLVDLKITDYCTSACPFCYQGSTKHGEHAQREKMRLIAGGLGEARVLEVVLGGGDPVQAEDFSRIIDELNSAGCVVSFSTRQIEWLFDDKLREKVRKSCSTFAYSARSQDEIERFAAAVEKSGWRGEKYVDYKLAPKIHLTLGTMDRWETAQCIHAAADAGLPVLLLSYKNVGFGHAFKQQEYMSWICDVLKDTMKVAQNSRGFSLSIDTPLAAEIGVKKLEKLGVSKRLYEVKEGISSAYIDGVKGTMHLSSYDGSAGVPVIRRRKNKYGHMMDVCCVREAYDELREGSKE